MKKLCRAALVALFAVSIAACEYAGDSAKAVEVAVAKEILTPRVDPDVALTEKVKSALAIDEAPAYGVEVTSTEGHVVLYGVVDKSVERRRFEIIAAGVVGVKSVENRIVVDPGA